MRLIDADALNFEKTKMPHGEQLKAILDFCDAQPTAYDVDKVVEQLEYLSDNFEEHCEGRKCPECEHNACIVCVLQHAIELVKAGREHE